MACQDIDLCDKVDQVNTYLLSIQNTQSTMTSAVDTLSYTTIALDDKLNSIGFYVYLLIIGISVYIIIRYIFGIIKSFALGW